MPSSDVKGKSKIVNFVRGRNHQKMLDIGCGEGTYAKLLPEAKWTGVEIWQPYVDEFKLHELYHNLHVMDARQWEPGDQRWDIAIAGDVLEHMTESEAADLLRKLRKCADWVIISIPFNMAQGEWGGNPYERHVKDDWTHEQIARVFGNPEWSHIEHPIGVYAWRGIEERPLKICIYAISKNEEQFVERFMESAKDADMVLIADTGSTDGTAEKARALGAKVPEICITPWRFDHARNAALSMIPRDIDVCISLDLDEVMEPGWREEIERVWKLGETTRLRYFFDWGCGIKFKYEKIHARHGYHWHHPCHEYPVADGRVTEIWADTDYLLVSHHPDPTKSRGQYLDLLKVSVTEDPRCPRNAFYYARELTFHGQWNESIIELNRYLALPGATWPNERCYAMRLLGKAYAELGNIWEAEKWLHMACGEAPNTREPWCDLSMLLYRQERWEECYAFAIRALRIVDRALVYTCDPAVWGAQPHDLASVAAWNIGLKAISLQQAKLAVSFEPDNERLKANVVLLTAEMTPEAV